MKTNAVCPKCSKPISFWQGFKEPVPFSIRCSSCHSALEVKLAGLWPGYLLLWISALAWAIGTGMLINHYGFWILPISSAIILCIWLVAELLSGVFIFRHAKFVLQIKPPIAAYLVVIGILAGTGIFLFLITREPIHQGKRLSIWIRELDDNQSVEKRKSAKDALHHFGSSAFPRLIELIKSNNRKDRDRATTAFHTLEASAQSAVPDLTQSLTHQDPEVRLSAAGALGFIGSGAEDAIPELVSASKHVHNVVRCNATFALGRIARKPEIVVPALVERLQDTSSVTRQNAAIGLGEFGINAKSAVPALLNALADSEERVRHDVGNALRRIAPDTAAEHGIREESFAPPPDYKSLDL